jgi:hypothetical protein
LVVNWKFWYFFFLFFFFFFFISFFIHFFIVTFFFFFFFFFGEFYSTNWTSVQKKVWTKERMISFLHSLDDNKTFTEKYYGSPDDVSPFDIDEKKRLVIRFIYYYYYPSHYYF